MFRDAKEELDRLESELLSQEDLEATKRLPEIPAEEEEAFDYDELLDILTDDDDEEEAPEPVSRYNAYNNDTAEVELEDYSQSVYRGKKDNLMGLMIAVLALMAAILGVLAWLLFRFGGLL